MRPEEKIEKDFNASVRRRGGMTFKMIPLVAGVPDRLVILPGVCASLVELKTETGNTRLVQTIMHQKLRRSGLETVILHGWAECVEWLDKMAPMP